MPAQRQCCHPTTISMQIGELQLRANSRTTLNS